MPNLTDPDARCACVLLRQFAREVDADLSYAPFDRWLALRALYHAELHITGLMPYRTRLGHAHPWNAWNAEPDNPAR